MSSKRLAQVLLVVSISTLLAAVLNEDNRTAWVVVTVVSHLALVWAGVRFARLRH